MTTGTSLIEAQPMPSIIRQKPGPEVDVAERAPVSAAPVAIVIAAISSSVCTTSIEAPSSFATAAPAASGPSPCPFSSRISRSEEHTSELQSPYELVCRLLLEKKNQK